MLPCDLMGTLSRLLFIIKGARSFMKSTLIMTIHKDIIIQMVMCIITKMASGKTITINQMISN